MSKNFYKAEQAKLPPKVHKSIRELFERIKELGEQGTSAANVDYENTAGIIRLLAGEILDKLENQYKKDKKKCESN